MQILDRDDILLMIPNPMILRLNHKPANIPAISLGQRCIPLPIGKKPYFAKVCPENILFLYERVRCFKSLILPRWLPKSCSPTMEFGRAQILKPLKPVNALIRHFPLEEVSYDVERMHLNTRVCNDLVSGFGCSK